MVFCHNDVLLANVVIQEDNVNFIDLEYDAAYDIANHFVEFVGCEGELDYLKWLPGRDWQMDWIREYMGGGQGVDQQQGGRGGGGDILTAPYTAAVEL